MYLVNASVLEEWNGLSDAQLAAQVLMVRTALFEVLMRRHNERVYRTAAPFSDTTATLKRYFSRHT